MSTIYAAHIVTSEAVGLGDPEIIVMTSDEGLGAEEVERWEITSALPHGYDVLFELLEHGYCPVGDGITYVENGYTIRDVEKI
jgi:hypothetical protein